MAKREDRALEILPCHGTSNGQLLRLPVWCDRPERHQRLAPLNSHATVRSCCQQTATNTPEQSRHGYSSRQCCPVHPDGKTVRATAPVDMQSWHRLD